MPEPVTTSMYFLCDDLLYRQERSYEHVYDPPNGLKRSNMKLEERNDITVEDIRGNGFCLMTINSELMLRDFGDHANIKNIYVREITHAVKQLLCAARVQIFDYAVSRCSTASVPLFRA